MQSSQSTVQVQRLYTRSPGTLAHRHAPRHTSTQAAVVSFPSHSHHIPITFPSPPSPACQYQNNNKQRDPCRPIRAGPIRAGPVAGPVKVRAHRNFSLLAVAQRRGRTCARVPAQGRTQLECRVPGAGGLGLNKRGQAWTSVDKLERAQGICCINVCTLFQLSSKCTKPV